MEKQRQAATPANARPPAVDKEGTVASFDLVDFKLAQLPLHGRSRQGLLDFSFCFFVAGLVRHDTVQHFADQWQDGAN